MSITERASSVAERLERIYLAALRVIILLFASVCILAAGYFAVDGVRRWATATEVKPEPVAVSPQEALQPLLAENAASQEEGGRAQGPSNAAKKTHAAFLTGAFAPYYAAYQRLASTYNKPEDTLLTREQLAKELGYTPEAIDGYDAGDSPVSQGLARTALLFQTDTAYATAQVAAVTTAMRDTRLLAKAQQYKAAQKTAQRCGTAYEVRAVWDSNSMACSYWYEYPYGCSVRRAVPVKRCEAAYPEGILSPVETIKRLDSSYRLSWIGKTEAANETAAAKTAEKEAVKAKAPAMWMLALQVFAGFLVIMFMFLLIAVERHLRRMSVSSELPEAAPTRLAA